MIRLLLFLVAACGDNARGPVDLVDAMPDASCVADASQGCCTLMPDEDAVRACAVDTFPVGACGVVACEMNDCSFAKVNVCHYPRCQDLPCDSLSCEGHACTCHQTTDGLYVSCIGD